MLTTDVRFEGWNTEDWVRFVALWRPRAATSEKELSRPHGGIVAIHERGVLRKLLHTVKGRVDLDGAWPMPLSELARTQGASWAIAAHTGALEEIMERFGARARRSDDLVNQVLSLTQIVRELRAEGALEMWPHRLRGVPTPTEPMVRRAIDSVCQDGRAVCLGMFHEGELHTGIVLRRKGRGFDVIAGPEEIRASMGLLSGDFRRDFRHLVSAVENRYAPLSFGCFAEVDTFRELQTDGSPGAWSRAVAVRDVVLAPIPTAVGVALGVDTARLAIDNVKVITKRLDPFGLLEPVLRTARSRFAAAAGDKDVSSTLGFDPLAVVRTLLRR
ncbi:MAG: hypothetical protein U0169_16655 [Polyangiaceae bacterium]